MKLKNQITYRFAQWMLILAMIFCMFNVIVLTAYVIKPFPPFVKLGEITTLGFHDYWKGIPLKAHTHTPIPDSSFNISYRTENGSGSAKYITYYHQDISSKLTLGT